MLHRVCWACWIGGAALIGLSRLEVVPADAGWAGFWVASAAAVLSYLRRGTGAPGGSEWAILTRAMIQSKNHAYEAAVERLRQGGAVLCDGLGVSAPPGDELWLTAVASVPVEELDEAQARRDALAAEESFIALARSAPDIAAVAAGRQVRVALLSEYGERGFPVCHVADGRVEWLVKGKREGALG